ncbi:SulP family inorganic anion transporter [Cupriavidus metallidurans]|jgi:sulfate permease, SulP family|uniref:SulP family inorganic anion transporter n=2 Tax=Cupriavidus TaxID=106589 RepID=UPI00076385ED|nr:SulP family inorganic anion transporter [Cupriavidus metallidurans]KWW36246.1 putative sulfate transporter [Cupriavidus metallidurans]
MRRQRRPHPCPLLSRRQSSGAATLPIPGWLLTYRKEWLAPDVIAGLTAAAVVIPKALAYATIAGLPVEVGLYTVFAPMLIYALLGSSRTLSVSTTTTLAILVAAAFRHVGPSPSAETLITASATLTFLVGAVLLVARLLRLGFVADFISEPVLIGFKAGIGLVIVVDQIPKLLGMHFPKGPFFHNVLAIIQNIPHASVATAAVGILMVLLLLGMEHRFPRAPAPLIAVAVGIIGVWLLNLTAHGVAIVGAVPTGLPPVTLPDPTMMERLWPEALGIALMSFTETIAAGRAFTQVGEHAPAANRELTATGLANLGGAFLGAMAAGGGTTQTAVNRLSGARSQLAGLVTALAALGTMLLLAPLVGRLPEATLAAVVIVYSVSLIKPAEFLAILGIRRTEFIWALVALAGVVALGTLQGIVVAIVVSMLALAYQTSDPPVYKLARKPGTNVFRPQSDAHPHDETVPGLLMLRPEGRVYFVNARRIGHKLRPMILNDKPKVVALDLTAVSDMEYTALHMLTDAERVLREEDGVMLWLIGMNPDVLDMVRRSALGQTLTHERMFFTMDLAAVRFQTEHADAVWGPVTQPGTPPDTPPPESRPPG